MKQIKVLNRTYSIIEKPVIEQGSALAGQIDHFKSEINICSELTDEHKKVVLIHELLHAIFMQLGYTEEHDNEELICSLSSILVQVLEDNQELLTLFSSASL